MAVPTRTTADPNSSADINELQTQITLINSGTWTKYGITQLSTLLVTGATTITGVTKTDIFNVTSVASACVASFYRGTVASNSNIEIKINGTALGAIGSWFLGGVSDGSFGIRDNIDVNGGPYFKIGKDASIQFMAIGTTASGANAFLDSTNNNNLLRSTSSLKYKKDIEKLSDKISETIYDMQPVWFRSKCDIDNPNWSFFGLIAEDIVKIEPRLVTWRYDEKDYIEEKDEKGFVTAKILKDNAQLIPDGVTYDKITVLLIQEIKKLRDRIVFLEKRLL